MADFVSKTSELETLDDYRRAMLEAMEKKKRLEVAIKNYKFPTLDDFKEGGRFANVHLPIPDDEPIPDSVLEYIFGDFVDSCKPRHIYNIRINLNKLLG